MAESIYWKPPEERASCPQALHASPTHQAPACLPACTHDMACKCITSRTTRIALQLMKSRHCIVIVWVWAAKPKCREKSSASCNSSCQRRWIRRQQRPLLGALSAALAAAAGASALSVVPAASGAPRSLQYSNAAPRSSAAAVWLQQQLHSSNADARAVFKLALPPDDRVVLRHLLQIGGL